MGGDVFINSEVVKINNTKKEVENIELASGEVIRGGNYISNLHPTLTFKLMNTDEIRKANVNRILGLKNTISAFILYIKLKPGTQKYNNYNHYHFFQEDVWNLHQYSEENPIKGIAVFNSRENKEDEHAITLTAMAYMHFEDVEKWQDTFNTTLSENDRGEEYLAFKDKWTEDLFAAVEQVYPDIRENTESYYTATPLTQRDYTGSIDGAIYGISHDYNAPLHSSIKAQTKLSNLFLTGQNIILHGVLGVTIGAIVTAQQILGKEYVVNKMKKFV
jgi:all-trans-retinol 13,14-reductase